MDPKQLFSGISEVFKKEKIEFAVIGAFGLHAYGYTRATKDIDFIVRLSSQPRILKIFDSLGFETLQITSAFSNHLHPLGSIRVDLMYIEGPTADSIFSKTKNIGLFNEITLPVVCPEHLIALKLFSASSDPSRKYKDLGDVQEIIKRTDVNNDDIYKYFLKYGFEEIYYEFTGKRKQ